MGGEGARVAAQAAFGAQLTCDLTGPMPLDFVASRFRTTQVRSPATA